jgi:hypothetical protein
MIRMAQSGPCWLVALALASAACGQLSNDAQPAPADSGGATDGGGQLDAAPDVIPDAAPGAPFPIDQPFNWVGTRVHDMHSELGKRTKVTIDLRDALYPAGCRQIVGQCLVSRCVLYSSHQPFPTMLGPGAGRIVASSEVTSCSTDGDGFCFFSDGPANQWPPGTKLDVSFDGHDDVPAFAASVVVPPELVLVAPTHSETQPPLAVDPNGDLHVEWQPLDATVRVVVRQGGTRMVGEVRDDLETQIECRFPGNAGSGTVPQAALEVLDPTEAALDVTALSESIAPSAAVAVRAQSEGTLIPLRIDADGPTLDGGVPPGCFFGTYLCDGPVSGSVCSSPCPEECWTYVSAPEKSFWACCCG